MGRTIFGFTDNIKSDSGNHGRPAYFQSQNQLSDGRQPPRYCGRGRDGKLDLVTANSGSVNVSLLVGNGNGSFQAKTDYAVGSKPHGVALGDLNRDGKSDLVAVNRGYGNVSVLLGTADGKFQTKTDYPDLVVAKCCLAKATEVS